MNVRHIGRTTAAAIAIGVLATGCTTSDPTPPTPTPVPTVSQTPTETAQQRQERIDYEAAEKSYRTFRAEYRRVLRKGGATEATALMKATAGGDYLDTFTKISRGYKTLGSHQVGTEKIVYVRPGGYSSKSVILNVCEDDRPVDVIQKNGKKYGKGEVRTAQLEVRALQGKWKVWSGQGEAVDSCQ